MRLDVMFRDRMGTHHNWDSVPGFNELPEVIYRGAGWEAHNQTGGKRDGFLADLNSRFRAYAHYENKEMTSTGREGREEGDLLAEGRREGFLGFYSARRDSNGST